jgi:uncharacterized protein (DUF849 family)
MPRTPSEVAADAAACVAAGATLLHAHAFDDDGRETLEAGAVARVLRALRTAVPGVGVNLTTFAAIEPDPRARMAAVSAWTDLPDLVAANQGEDGIDDLSAMLAGRGVQVEACALSVADARLLVARGRPERFVRVYLESLLTDPDDAVAEVAEMEAVLEAGGVLLPQVHHGTGRGTWAVLRRAVARGHGIRVGVEDTVVHEDGRTAEGNADLVRAAADLLV